ncbi:hypothetical protein [Bacillus thuringiensis]|uniref:hypothetical protein n=1 Tax=Bacillus thuringiensis TaxID=1428 RepID=UPI0021D68BA6|nr:hypothetical protein [Bacillus thuringiensis]MCU7667102.1 hypothetical protein [Bacillus thuringiensis]
MNQNQITTSQIETIKTAGFTKVKWYDEDLNYSYFDAFLNESKVEIRMTEQSLEWRYLGIPIEEVEWFSIKTSQNTEEQNKEYNNELNNDEKHFSSEITENNFIEPMEQVTKVAETEIEATAGPVTLETEIEATAGPVTLETEIEATAEPVTLETKVEIAEPITLETEIEATAEQLDLFDVVAIG